MPVPTDPYNFTNGPGNTADGDQVDERFKRIYDTLNPAQIGIDDSNIKPLGIGPGSLSLSAVGADAVWEPLVELDYRNGIFSLATTPCWVGGNTIIPSGSGANGISGLWVPPTASDIAVAGKTTRLRVRACYAPNAVAPGITLTWGLYPITALGGVVSSTITVTLGTVVAGSTAAVASPPASQTGEAKSGSFDLSLVPPPSGYVIGVVGSGAQAANSLLGCTAYLEMRHT